MRLEELFCFPFVRVSMETPLLGMSSSPEPSAWMQAEHTADAVICFSAVTACRKPAVIIRFIRRSGNVKMSRTGEQWLGWQLESSFCLCVDVTEQMCFLLVHETMGSEQQRYPQIRSQATSAGAYQHHERERDCFKITEMDPAVCLLPSGKQFRRKSHFKWRYKWWGLCFQFRKVWLRNHSVFELESWSQTSQMGNVTRWCCASNTVQHKFRNFPGFMEEWWEGRRARFIISVVYWPPVSITQRYVG